MKRYLWGVATGVIVMLVVPLVVAVTGVVNMGASTKPSALEKNLATLAVNASMYWRTPAEQNPAAGDNKARSDGLAHFSEMCVRCHGAPGVERQEFAKGLNPPAPPLDHARKAFSDAELFWITKNGIRMTAMPAFGATHNDGDIWKIVEAVKALGDLTPDEKDRLKNEGQELEGHHHAADTGGGENELKHGHAEQNN
ncbi:c-type cytochrome [Botrimarina mediterranea]|uniref:c-type cytochrome n=1 Tax=Botrimarina mediterranea TaxID=2528022 RepID=UPI00118C9E4D|nr:hypothetical protein K2D_19420 [Planctomycetes bacterium K2D]